jgi:hypothetical protein
MPSLRAALAASLLSSATSVFAQTPGTFDIVGNSGVSALQMVMGTNNTVSSLRRLSIVSRLTLSSRSTLSTRRRTTPCRSTAMQHGTYPARMPRRTSLCSESLFSRGSEYDLRTNQARAMTVRSNTFWYASGPRPVYYNKLLLTIELLCSAAGVTLGNGTILNVGGGSLLS